VIVYVAGASAEESRVRKAMDVVRRSPHKLAHDWLRVIEAHGSANLAVPPGPARTVSLMAFSHLRRSGILWLLFPQEDTIGTWIETGAFMMHASTLVGTRIIMSGGDTRASVFLNGLVTQAFETDREAGLWLEGQRAA
jgi:hypothetical protein